MKRTSQSPILVVDDSDDDIFLFRLLLKKIGATAPFFPMQSGEAALAWLGSLPQNAAIERPFVCFLDVRMPRVDGFECLRWIRSHRYFDSLPVVMLSTSDAPQDIQRASELGAQAYLTKYPSTAVLSEVLAHASIFSDGGGPVKGAFQQPYNLLQLLKSKHHDGT